MISHEACMRAAITEARKAMGRTHPNPAVGAVITQKGEIVAAGHTQPVGQDHAEIVALKAYQSSGLVPDESTRLYVTMEPCCTTGRTPPCTEAIIASGIRHVLIGATDPNPDHAGRGYQILEEASLVVETGLLEGDCDDLNLIFNWRMAHDRPFFAGKIATTIDGRIATRGGSSKWITGEAARADVHAWRDYFPAIAVGAGTALIDDPSLTIRIPGQEEGCPVRFIFDRNLISFRNAIPQVYTDQWREKTIIVTNASKHAEAEAIRDKYGIAFWTLDDSAPGDPLAGFVEQCGDAGIDGVFIEGGARLLSSFIQTRRLDYLFAYRAPKVLADESGLGPFMGQAPAEMKEALSLKSVRHTSFGDDQLMRGFVVYPNS
jgi:diaminohydroxyphosphoribosylaminopyrimidine deaminase/5-amino-6-(5-phosphoribosylamino)uracil reductase